MKYFIIAGEPSGDLHGSHLVADLCKVDIDAEIKGMGGDKMESAGMDLLVHYRDYSFMGFWEVLVNLRKIKSLLTVIKKAILEFHPDKVILIDYGGFNLKIARFCKEHGIETHFFILPKVWAWNEKRVNKIRSYVDHGYCIFPFEEMYFQNHGVHARYVGNPVQKQVSEYLDQSNPSEPIENRVALLPGSRKQEVEKMLPVMLKVAEKRPDLDFILAAHHKDMIAGFVLPENVHIATKSTFDTLRSSQAALVTSGTANLETALLGIPQVVCYKANPVSYFIGKRVVKINYISPVNLIMDKLVIKELIQNELNPVNLEHELNRLLDVSVANSIRKDYKQLADILGNKSATMETAKMIFEG